MQKATKPLGVLLLLFFKRLQKRAFDAFLKNKSSTFGAAFCMNL